MNRFLLRRFFGGVGLVMLVVCGIIFAVTFVERLPSNPTIAATLYDAWVRLLEYIPLFLPMAVFMGTLLASYNLTKSSESVIVSGAGLSPYQASRSFFVGAALIGIVATTIVNPYSVKISSQSITGDRLQLVDGAIWLRETGGNGYLTMRARSIHREDAALVFDDAVIFTQDSDFKLTRRVTAAHIYLHDNEFAANDAQLWNANGTIKHSDWETPTNLTPQTVLDRYMQPNQISFWQLPSFISKMQAVGVPVRGHLVQFWTLLFLPLTMIAMATLGVAFSQTRQRRNFSFGIKFSIGILTCFAVYFTINMFNALGATGTLPALIAIVAPPLIIIAGAGAFIASFDTL